MKFIKSKYLKLTLGLFLILVSSCDLQEANVNPNSATDATVNVLLPSTQVNLVWAVNDFAAQSTSTLVQYMTGTLNVQANVTNYEYLPANFQTTWGTHFYAGTMKDLKTIIEKSTELGAVYYRGVARIQMAMALGYIVDLWGDAPYSQAMDIIQFPKPAYETGEELYTEVFKLLDEGIADLGSATSVFTPSRDDLFFPATTEALWKSASLPRWVKTARALKARYHNHLSKVNPEGSAQDALDAIAEVNAVAAGTFANNNEELKVSFGTTSDAAGPWYGFLLNSFGQNNISISQSFITKLKDRVAAGVDDPRLAFYVKKNADNIYLGTPYGESMVSKVSVLGTYVNAPAAPTNMITYAEVKFIEAEAHFRLGNFGPAATAFNDAIKASILRVTGASNPAYEALYASETAATIQVNGLQKIFTEKYIAMFLQTEAWADWRRSIPAGAAGTVSGIPVLQPSAANSTQGVFPRRFVYPLSELDNNSAEVPPLTLTDRVFWDK
jgi:hypothetical protein